MAQLFQIASSFWFCFAGPFAFEAPGTAFLVRCSVLSSYCLFLIIVFGFFKERNRVIFCLGGLATLVLDYIVMSLVFYPLSLVFCLRR